MCINFQDIQSYTCIYFRHTIMQKCLSQFSDKGCLEITLLQHTLQSNFYSQVSLLNLCILVFKLEDEKCYISMQVFITKQ
jgi:hypothetical protein